MTIRRLRIDIRRAFLNALAREGVRRILDWLNGQDWSDWFGQ